MKYFLGTNIDIHNDPSSQILFNIYDEEKAFPNKEKNSVDYDSFFSNQKLWKKGKFIMINIFHRPILKLIDSNFIEEIKKRFPDIMVDNKQKNTFWKHILNFQISEDFYYQYEQDLHSVNMKAKGFLRIYNLPYSKILENKELFNNTYDFKYLLEISHTKQGFIELSDYFVKYMKEFTFGEYYYYGEHFLQQQLLDLDFIKLLVEEYGWGYIFRGIWKDSMLQNFHIIDWYYYIIFDEDDPTYETQLKHETLLLEQFKKIINCQ